MSQPNPAKDGGNINSRVWDNHYPNDPDDDNSSKKSDKYLWRHEERDTRHNSNCSRIQTERSIGYPRQNSTNQPYDTILGINGIKNDFIRKQQFVWGCKEDFNYCQKVYNSFSDMCQVGDDEMLWALPIILRGDVLSVYSIESNNCQTFDESEGLLHICHNTDGGRCSTLTKNAA